jgi:hypothetical protein
MRAVLLALLILTMIVVPLPLTNSLAHSEEKPAISTTNNVKRSRYRSRAWWRKRAALRRKRAAWRRKRAAILRRRRALIAARAKARARANQLSQRNQRTERNKMTVLAATTASNANIAWYSSPVGMKLPTGWNRVYSTAKESKFNIQSTDGKQSGVATLTTIDQSILSNSTTGAALVKNFGRNSIGNISFAALRRTVIDKMLEMDGWVVNDMERVIANRRTFIVIAQTPTSSARPGTEPTWVFYFTEIDGRIHSLALNASPDAANSLTEGTEQFLSSLRSNTQTEVTAGTK